MKNQYRYLLSRLSRVAMLTLAVAAAGTCAVIAPPFVLGEGTGSLSASVDTPNNTLTVTETIDAFSSANRFYMSYAMPGPLGATHYDVTKTVTNNTGNTWLSFQIGFGCGMLGDVACFGNPFADPITMDYSVSPTLSVAGTLAAQGASYILWTDLSIAQGQTATFNFSLNTCGGCSGGWAMIETATTAPEPGQLVLACSGLLLIGASRLLRRRRV